MQAGNENRPAGREHLNGDDNARLVELCAAQLQAAVAEAKLEMDALSSDALATARQVTLLVGELGKAGGGGAPGLVTPPNVEASEKVKAAVNSMIFRLQFVDRFNQRLTNVQKNLLRIAGSMHSAAGSRCEIELANLRSSTRATFTTEHEREIFDAVMCKPQRSRDGSAGGNSTTKPPGGVMLFEEDGEND